MDISSLVGTLMSSDSVSNLGKTTKTDNGTVKNVLSAALPSLLNGAKAQSEDSSSGFADALLSHGKKDTSNLASFLGGVDMTDGGKILGHLLGSKSDDEISGIAKKAGASKKDTSDILSAAAPLLMSLLGKQSSSSSGNSMLGDIASTLLQNVDVSDILGNLLGAGDSDSKSSASKTKKKTASSAKKKTSSSKKKEENSVLGAVGDILGKLLK